MHISNRLCLCFYCRMQMILASNDAGRGSLNIKVENFRPNLLVAGGSGAPHQEDTWKTITLLGQPRLHSTEEAATPSAPAVPLALQITGPCSRCSMVNVDGSSGSMDCRAFQALSTYRKDGSSVYFGQFCALPAGLEQAQDNDNMWISVDSVVDAI